MNAKNAWNQIKSGFLSSKYKNNQQPEVIIIQPPNNQDIDDSIMPEKIIICPDRIHGDIIEISTGIPMIATAIEKYTQKKVAVWWGQNIRDENSHHISPHTLAQAIIGSKAKIIGLSLLNPSQIGYSKKVLQTLKNNNYHFKVMVGGPLTTSAPQFTAQKLSVPQSSILTQKGVNKAIKFVINKKQINPVDELIDINPDFIKINNPHKVTPYLCLIRFGQKFCIGKKCSFCAANILGEEQAVPLSWVLKQLNSFSKIGIQTFNSAENWINFIKNNEFEQLLAIMKHAQNKQMKCGFIFTRPEAIAHPARTISDYQKLKNLGVQTIGIGVESASIITLKQMHRINPISDGKYYLKSVNKAAEKVISTTLTCMLSFIVGYPIFSSYCPDRLIDPIKGANEDMKIFPFLKQIINSHPKYKKYLKVNINPFVYLHGTEISNKVLSLGNDWQSIRKWNFPALNFLIRVINSILEKPFDRSTPNLNYKDLSILLKEQNQQILREALIHYRQTMKVLNK